MVGCKYEGTSAKAAWMVGRYRLLVDKGGVPLHECPLWLVEVADEVRRYRAKMRARQEEDRRAREKCQEIVNRHQPRHPEH